MPPLAQDELAAAVADYAAASKAALKSEQLVADAWIQYFDSAQPEPSAELLAEARALQASSAVALERARLAVTWSKQLGPAVTSVEELATGLPGDEASGELQPSGQIATRVRPSRRRENKFLSRLGRRTQIGLRACLFVLFTVALLVCSAAAMSLSLEIAGFLNLIEDPVQFPVAGQLVIFAVALGVCIGTKTILRELSRTLERSSSRQGPVQI